MRVLIVKTGSTVAPLLPRRGDFERWFREGMALDDEQAPAVAPYDGEPLPDPRDVPAAVVTGSPAMVTDAAPWSLATERWLAELVELGRPVLGVCYGHQLLARAFGGTVVDCPAGLELGTTRVELTAAGREDPLFADLPAEFPVHAAHSQSVVELPRGARHLARNDHDAHQAFAIGERAWGVQFHPEFDADIVRGYAAARADRIREQGRDPHAVAEAAHDNPHGRRILRRFLDLAGDA